MRYAVFIEFKHFGQDRIYREVKPLLVSVKTLREALSYKDLVDESVSKAVVIDNVTKSIVETWK